MAQAYTAITNFLYAHMRTRVMVLARVYECFGLGRIERFRQKVNDRVGMAFVLSTRGAQVLYEPAPTHPSAPTASAFGVHVFICIKL